MAARWSSVSAAAVITMPGVQNPHWKPWAASNAAGTSSGTPCTVVTARPAARTAG